MTAIRDPIAMPDEFVLVFEGRTVQHTVTCRTRKCPHCSHFQTVLYGRNMSADTHVCWRDGIKHIVVWKTL